MVGRCVIGSYHHYSGICPPLTKPQQGDFPRTPPTTMPHSNSKFHYSLSHQHLPPVKKLVCTECIFMCISSPWTVLQFAANICFHFLCFVFKHKLLEMFITTCGFITFSLSLATPLLVMNIIKRQIGRVLQRGWP